MANSVDQGQTAPIGAVCAGSILFASILNSSVMLGNYLQQATSTDDIFICSRRIQQTTFSDAFFPCALRDNFKILKRHSRICNELRFGQMQLKFP